MFMKTDARGTVSIYCFYLNHFFLPFCLPAPSIGKKFLKWVSRKISTSVAPVATGQTDRPDGSPVAGGGGGGASRKFGVDKSEKEEEDDFMPTSNIRQDTKKLSKSLNFKI